MKLFASVLAIIFSAGAVSAAEYVSTYQSLYDKQACQYTQIVNQDEPSFAKYVCSGPVEGIVVELTTESEFEGVVVTIGSQKYDLYQQFSAVGHWSGLGNDKGLIEWMGVKGSNGYVDPKGLIIRMSGVINSGDPDNQKTVKKLAVYGINGDKLCFKGFAPQTSEENEKAREMVKTGKCVSPVVKAD